MFLSFRNPRLFWVLRRSQFGGVGIATWVTRPIWRAPRNFILIVQCCRRKPGYWYRGSDWPGAVARFDVAELLHTLDPFPGKEAI